jgi:hypothetical protein
VRAILPLVAAGLVACSEPATGTLQARLWDEGTVDQFGVTPQHGFGAAGEYRLGDTLLLAGQEHPRTHFLGHTITLGADTAVDLRDTYIAYDTFWRAAAREHGLPGYAHFGPGPARDGLALDAPRGLSSPSRCSSSSCRTTRPGTTS